MIYSRIVGTGSYLPEKILTNDDMSKIVDTSNEWIVERTGIHQRHIASENDTASSMAEQAARRALEAAGIEPEALGLIIVATSTPDRIFPSTASLLQHRLGISGCAAFDVTAACAGFLYGLGIADQFIRTGNVDYVLVVGSELMSQIVDWTDRSTCVIFADGAAAVVLKASKEPGILSTHLHSDGQYQDLLYTTHGVRVNERPYVKMSGREVFKIAVNHLEEIVHETLGKNQMEKSQVDWLVPHQANLRIISSIANKLNLPMEQVVVTIDKHGNTSAASIPLALDCAVRDGRIKKDDILLLESFGAGFAWASALVRF